MFCLIDTMRHNLSPAPYVTLVEGSRSDGLSLAVQPVIDIASGSVSQSVSDRRHQKRDLSI